MSARIAVRVQASASENTVVGIRDDLLIVRVTAPAIEGRANESLSRLLAERLRVPRSSVTVIRGQHSRDKLIEIAGLDHQALLNALTQQR